jgi:dihydrofolate synthase / folylpolyglutamate synthase
MADDLTPSYQDALAFLYSFVDYERTGDWRYDGRAMNLDRVRGLLADIGDPHTRGQFIHIAGTNGKGSVAAMVAGSLHRAGLTTGLYTSPHLLTFRERIRVDGIMIGHDDVIAGVDRLRPLTDQHPGLTFFDVWTVLAFDYFARRGTDVAVIEVGMGGRLDTTNVVTPVVSVITPVALDHRGKLGDTAAEIAREKAGIIKPGVTVVSAPQEHAVRAVLEQVALEQNAPLVAVGIDVSADIVNNGIVYRGLEWALDDVIVGMPGGMQCENAVTALATLESAERAGVAVTPEAAREALGSFSWPGRLQVVAEHPEIVLDGACNPAAMAAVRKWCEDRPVAGTTVAVFSICRDKEVDTVFALLGECVDTVITTAVDNPRITPSDELAARAPNGLAVLTVPDADAAIDRAIVLAGPEGRVIVTGSLYLVGEALQRFAPESVDRI